MTGLIILGAFSVGVCVGVALDDAWTLFHDKKVAGMTRQDEDGGMPLGNPRVLAIILVAASVALAVVGIMLMVTRAETERYSRCTAEWQQQFSMAYVARATAAAEVSTAVDRVMLSVERATEADATEKEAAAFQRALDNYVAVRDEQQAERAKHPLPPLPETLCGER